MEEIKTYRAFSSEISFLHKSRQFLRQMVLGGASLSRSIVRGNNWVRFPYYHHVFDDEKLGFDRQIRYLKRFGDFISIDEACSIIGGTEPIDGRFFCLSFDDGFRCCYSNMMEICVDLAIPVIIYLPTNMIGLDSNCNGDAEKILQFYPDKPKLIPFLSWEQCKEMLPHRITFGSHTCSHAHLAQLSESEIIHELKQSKEVIEQQLNTPCYHFACPWGRTHIDFSPEPTLSIAKQIGYLSFATTNRGAMRKDDNPYLLKRDHLLAGWENYQLKFFFGE